MEEKIPGFKYNPAGRERIRHLMERIPKDHEDVEVVGKDRTLPYWRLRWNPRKTFERAIGESYLEVEKKGLLPTPEHVLELASQKLGIKLYLNTEFMGEYNRVRRKEKPSPESWEPAIFGESLPRDPLTRAEIPMSASCCRECRRQFD